MPSRPAGPVTPRTGTTVVGILPLYNGELWVEGALESVLAQTRLPDEFIVVDDGSTDGGAAIVRRIAEKHPFIKLVSQLNAGQSAARNLAISLSKCTYIALIDQDDVWYPNHIEDLLEAVKGHRGMRLGWVYSDFDDIDLDGRLINRDFIAHSPSDNPKRDLIAVLSQGFWIQPSATLINREAVITVGGFDVHLSGYEDDDLFLRLFMASYDNVFIPKPTSQWRIHASSSGGSDRMDDSLRYYTQKLLDAFPDDLWRGYYYGRDVIAPRFIFTWIQMYIRASRYKNRQKMKLYAMEARKLLPHLRPRARLRYSWILFVLRQPLFIRFRVATVDSRSIGWGPFVAMGRKLGSV